MRGGGAECRDFLKTCGDLRRREPLTRKLCGRTLETIGNNEILLDMPETPGRAKCYDDLVARAEERRRPFKRLVGILQKFSGSPPCKRSVVAERTNKIGSGSHHDAFILRKRNAAHKTPHATENRHRIVQCPEGIDKHIETIITKTQTYVLGKTAAKK